MVHKFYLKFVKKKKNHLKKEDVFEAECKGALKFTDMRWVSHNLILK